MRRRKTILRVEILEDRCTPATWGNPWPDASHLSLSFVPDGTQVGNRTSNLFETMNAVAPTSVWENAILQAFQTWAARANIDVAVVPDSGLPLGTTGNIEGDNRFGDIRIVAYPMAQGAIAEAAPFQLDAGTWAGDVQFNSTASFSVNGDSQAYDLFSVALHEAGHVFGFDDNDDPASVMYGNYSGVQAALGASDVANVQALYGLRTNPKSANNSFSNAIVLNPTSPGNGSLFASTTGSLASAQDQNLYSFTSRQDYGAVNITLSTVGISSLTPQVTVYDSSGNPVIVATDTHPQHGGLVIHLTNVPADRTFYVKVASAQANVFGVGKYQLRIRELPVAVNGQLTATVSQGATTSSGLLDPSHTNTSFAAATPLTSFGSSNSTAYATARSSLNGASDVAYYSMQAPSANSTTTVGLTVMIWGLQDQFNLRVQVFDTQHNLLPAQIIVNDGYTYAVQIADATPGANYYVKVVHSTNGHAAGNYFLGVNFSPNPLVMETRVSGSLSNARPTVLKTFDTSAADHGNLFHFILSAQANAYAYVQVGLTDALGQVAFTLTADTAESTSANVLLAPGVYYATFLATTPSGQIPALGFLLLGDKLTNPIGPEGTDPSGDPGGGSGGGGSPPPPPPWTDGSTPGIGSNPPASNPYSPTSPVVTLQNPTDRSNLAGDSVQLTLTATDSAGNALSYSVVGLPAGLSINAITGVISGRIANNAANALAYVVTVTATDTTANSSASQKFYWTVNPPIVTLDGIDDQHSLAGDDVIFQISGTSSDGYALTYSADGLPPGLTMDSTSGVISGHIANNAAADTPHTITFVATDSSSGVSSSRTFQWTVDPPELSTTNPGDQSNSRGDDIYLAISASCSDGAALTYGAANLPPGLTIGANTGVISGAIPENNDTTSYCIVINILDPTSGVETTITFNWTIG